MEAKTYAKFSVPLSAGDCIIVSRILPDGKKEIIGSVLQECSEDGSVEYVSYNSESEEPFLRTTSWSDIENEFERYAKRLMQMERADEIEAIREQRNLKELKLAITH